MISPVPFLLAFGSVALGSPVFKGKRPYAAHAEQAWLAASECAGRPSPQADLQVVTVRKRATRRRRPAGRALRRGRDGRRGTIRIRFDADERHSRAILSHEVAHLWTPDSAGLLGEGQAESLTRCIHETGEGFGPSYPLEANGLEVPDLLHPSPKDPGWEESYYYSALLFETLKPLIPELWTTNWSWGRLHTELRRHCAPEIADHLTEGVEGLSALLYVRPATDDVPPLASMVQAALNRCPSFEQQCAELEGAVVYAVDRTGGFHAHCAGRKSKGGAVFVVPG